MMKKPLIISASMTAILTIGIMQSAHAILINDDYIGGVDHGYGDVIGDERIFGVDSMDVELLSNNLLSVVINTNFAGRGDESRFSSSTQSGNGIGYGDLFLSDTWVVESDNDNFFAPNTTDWSLGFSLGDERWTDGGTGTLYSLDGNDANDILLSNDFLNRNTFRDGQEIAVDTTGRTDGMNSRTWTVDDANNTISFLIDLTGTSLEGSDTIALHWGMTCGNDTIEGEYSVPEPGMLALLALGLLGIGVSQVKRD